MYKNDMLRIGITIDLENGIYTFNGFSATGKTRLFRLLRELQRMGEQILTYTYTDKIDIIGTKLSDVLIPNKYKVIMLDRYDMYLNDCAEIIKECSKNSIVLIDCKRLNSMKIGSDWCDLIMTEDAILVED